MANICKTRQRRLLCLRPRRVLQVDPFLTHLCKQNKIQSMVHPKSLPLHVPCSSSVGSKVLLAACTMLDIRTIFPAGAEPWLLRSFGYIVSTCTYCRTNRLLQLLYTFLLNCSSESSQTSATHLHLQWSLVAEEIFDLQWPSRWPAYSHPCDKV